MLLEFSQNHCLISQPPCLATFSGFRKISIILTIFLAYYHSLSPFSVWTCAFLVPDPLDLMFSPISFMGLGVRFLMISGFGLTTYFLLSEFPSAFLSKRTHNPPVINHFGSNGSGQILNNSSQFNIEMHMDTADYQPYLFLQQFYKEKYTKSTIRKTFAHGISKPGFRSYLYACYVLICKIQIIIGILQTCYEVKMSQVLLVALCINIGNCTYIGGWY